MPDVEYGRKPNELDHSLNDLNSKLELERVCSLLAEISQQASHTPGRRLAPAEG